MNLQQSSSIPALFSDHDFAYDLNEVANLTMLWNILRLKENYKIQ